MSGHNRHLTPDEQEGLRLVASGLHLLDHARPRRSRSAPTSPEAADTGDDDTKLLSPSELAAEVGLPESWLKSEADAERIPHLKAEDEYRFSLRAVRECLARRAAKGGVKSDF